MRTIRDIQLQILEDCVERWRALFSRGEYEELLYEYHRERFSPNIAPRRRQLLLRATRGCGVRKLQRLAFEQRSSRMWTI